MSRRSVLDKHYSAGEGGSVANDTPHDLICDKGAACRGWC